MPDNPSRALVAEAIGTFALCFIGILAINAGSIIGHPDASTLTTIAFGHGLAIAVMIAAYGAVSGGHFNPAVTFGFVVTGRMPLVRGVMYWVAQIAGAFVASEIICQLFGASTVAGGTPNLAPTISPAAGVVLELVTTFFLVAVVFGTAVDERAPKSVFPLAIGLTVALDIMAIGPITGGAMNPARVLGPALASGMWQNHWIYWVGPLAGGALAGLLHHYFFIAPAPTVPVAEHGGPTPGEQRAGS